MNRARRGGHRGQIVRSLGTLAALTILGWSTAEGGSPAAVIPYIVYDGYFVSNKFEPDVATSFVVLQDQRAFDRVFGVASFMFDRARRLQANPFRSRIVAATIHRGHEDVRYRIIGVVRDGTVLQVRYTTTVRPTPLTEFACPLILSVPRDNYSTVAFIENGTLVKTVRIFAR